MTRVGGCDGRGRLPGAAARACLFYGASGVVATSCRCGIAAAMIIYGSLSCPHLKP